MLKHMIRLLTPDSGRVWIGEDCISEARGRRLEQIRARFGVLFQSGALLAWLSAGDNVGLPLRQRTNDSDADIDRLAAEKLALVGLADAFDKLPAELSGGMRKRVGLARAIITQPEIVLYDEPTSGLDPVTARTIDALIDSLRQSLGITSVVVTHDLHSALAIGSRYSFRQAPISQPVCMRAGASGRLLWQSMPVSEYGVWVALFDRLHHATSSPLAVGSPSPERCG